MKSLRLLILVLAIGCAAVLGLAGCSDSETATEPETEPEVVVSAEETFYHVDQVDDEGRHVLSPQDVAPEVVEVQQRFEEWDLPVEVNGVYDDDTLAIMLAFQYSQGLVPDGVVGPNTWDALADPTALPAELDPLELVEIARVALESPSDARQMVEELEERTGLDPDAEGDAAPEDGGSPGSGGETDEEDNPDGLYAVVSLGDQHVRFYDGDGDEIADFPISSGANGLTPVGEFAVQSKSPTAWSSGNSDVTMDWMTRFNGGIGFHGIPEDAGTPLDTPLGERPVSHGCVRMANDDAQAVYDTLPVGAAVIVQH